MAWLWFFLGMMVGSTVGVGAMCVIFYAREPSLPVGLQKTWTQSPP